MAQITIPIQKVENVEDVITFFETLTQLGVSFHPDDSFSDTINTASNTPTFSDAEAIRLDNLMDACFEVCNLSEIDIYDLAMDAFRSNHRTKKLKVHKNEGLNLSSQPVIYLI